MTNKKRGLLLLEAIGEIPEKYIADAKNTRIYTIRRLAVAAAVLILIASAVLAPILIHTASSPAETVTVESDFVLELSLDREGRILLCKADSTRGRQVMQNIDFTGLPLQDAVGEIASLLTEKGSLTPQQNTVMISCTGDSLTETVNTLSAALNKTGITPALLATQLKEKEYLSLSEKHHISRAKAKLISEIASQTDCEMKYLLRLTLGELNLIAQAHSLVFSDILCEGETDKSALITQENAADIAIREYRVDLSDILSLFYSLDASQDGLYYTIKIKTNAFTYLCLIDAYSGGVIKEIKSGSASDDDREDKVSTPLPIPSQNGSSSYSAPAEPEDSGSEQNDPTPDSSQNTPAETQGESNTNAPSTQAKTPAMLKKTATSSDSTDGEKLYAEKLGSVDILSWTSSSQEQLAVVYSKEQMEELISDYSSLKYATDELRFWGGDLLSDEFYQNYCAAVLIIYAPRYDYINLDRTVYSTPRFASAYLSGDKLSLNLEDTHENTIFPYAEFIRLNRADVINVTSIR